MRGRNADKLRDDLRLVVSDAEALIKETAGAAGEHAHQARSRIERSLAGVKSRLAAAGESAGERATNAARAAKTAAEQHPWAALGSLAVIGLIVGMLISRK